MELCKNKNSGIFFIHIDHDGFDRRLLVTPEAHVRSLKAHLFDEPLEIDEIDLREKRMVTDRQLEVYRVYEKLIEGKLKGSYELVQEFGILFSGMSPLQREKIKKKLRRMLGTV
jgi:hypothetical protein